MSDAASPIAAISADDSIVDASSRAKPAAQADGGFAAWFEAELHSVNASLLASERGLQQTAAGAAVSVHEVMMRAEEARLSFQLLVQVRNRVLEAYQEVMRVQG